MPSVCRAVTVLALTSSLASVEARLGGADGNSTADELAEKAAPKQEDIFARGGPARSVAYWTNRSDIASADEVGVASMQSVAGYEYMATTTRYGNTCCASCGSLDTARVVQGTEYYAVASAQAMQDHFAAGSCCWCGQAGSQCGLGSGVAPMGCGGCARGRFIKKRPYDAPMWAGDDIFEKEIKIVVADICPHDGNEAWCPRSVGHVNTFGAKNHFDFASPPAQFDNYYFAFTPEPCPSELQQNLRMSQCNFL